jgi:hypothetical protein
MTLEAGQPVLKVNLRKLKQRLIDTDELIGLYSTARSREDFLEQSVLLERRAKMAAEAAIAESESRCRTALKTVREREEDMAVLRQTVREREAEATALRQTVLDREVVATALRKTIREREAEATALRQRLSGFEAEMKEALHAEKEARLAAQRELAAERSKRQAGGATPEPLRKADRSQEHSDELPLKRARLSSSSAPYLEESGTAVTAVPDAGSTSTASSSSSNLSAAGLLPDSVITTARRGSVTLVLRMLEGELMRWLFSACALRTADAAAPLTSVVIQPSGVGAASIEVLQKLLSERGDDWMREWLSGLARAIVGTDRCLPLAPPSLQRAVIACHLFASCCRERGDTKRVRALCFDLARYRRCDEAALLAALCSAWPQALHSKGCDEMPHMELPTMDEPATMAWQLQPGAPMIAVLALRLRRQLEATRGERRALLERARTVLIRYGGRAWDGAWDGDGDASRRRPTDAQHNATESQVIEFLIHSLLRSGPLSGAVTGARPPEVQRPSGAVTGARPPEVQRLPAANGRTSAVTSAPGTTPQSRQSITLPMASAVEGCVALELLAAGCEWSWTVNTLIRGMLLPLLAPEQGAHVSALLRLLGRLGQLAPNMEDPGVSWLRQQLHAALGVDAPTTAPRFSPAEEACAVAALLELVPPGTPAHEARGAMQAIELWLRSQPKSWEQAVPATLRDRYYEYAREDREL